VTGSPGGSPRVPTVRTSAKAGRQRVVRGDAPGHGEVVLLLLAFEQAPEIGAAEHAEREESGIILSHVLDDIDASSTWRVSSQRLLRALAAAAGQPSASSDPRVAVHQYQYNMQS